MMSLPNAQEMSNYHSLVSERLILSSSQVFSSGFDCWINMFWYWIEIVFDIGIQQARWSEHRKDWVLSQCTMSCAVTCAAVCADTRMTVAVACLQNHGNFFSAENVPKTGKVFGRWMKLLKDLHALKLEKRFPNLATPWLVCNLFFSAHEAGYSMKMCCLPLALFNREI